DPGAGFALGPALVNVLHPQVVADWVGLGGLALVALVCGLFSAAVAAARHGEEISAQDCVLRRIRRREWNVRRTRHLHVAPGQAGATISVRPADVPPRRPEFPEARTCAAVRTSFAAPARLAAARRSPVPPDVTRSPFPPDPRRSLGSAILSLEL